VDWTKASFYRGLTLPEATTKADALDEAIAATSGIIVFDGKRLARKRAERFAMRVRSRTIDGRLGFFAGPKGRLAREGALPCALRRPAGGRGAAFPQRWPHRDAWHEGARKKTALARRMVPIHAETIGLGLFDFAAAARAGGNRLLFPEIRNAARQGTQEILGLLLSPLR
jgi:hypothetical protein